MPPPPTNDIETGLNGQPVEDYYPEYEKAPNNAPARGSATPSVAPSGVERSANPELKDVWNKWIGKPTKETKAYSQPPQKGERYELETFQNLVGIHFLRPGGGLLHPEDQGTKPASPMHDIFLPTKAAARRWRNRGLYERTLSQDVRSRVLYGMSNYIISFLYLLQILIAAALTGLSAYQQASSVALTTLGAINTVLAGILAWLNGQGMPVRFRRARDQFREVVRAIEDTERTFAEIDYIDWAPGTRPNPYAERDRLEQMYEEARQDLERNYPDIQEGPNKSQMEGEAKQLKETISGEKSKVGAFAKTLEKTRDDHKKQLKDLEEGFTNRIKNALNEQKDQIRTEVEFEHLQKKYEEEKADFEARLAGRPRQPREQSPRRGEQDKKPNKAPEGPKEEAKPREQPRGGSREGPREGPREGKPRNRSRDEPQAKPREVPRERSRARSPSRSRAKSPARSPVRAPARQGRSPSRPRARSQSSSPSRSSKSSPKPRARSPARPAGRSPSSSRSRSPARPKRSPSRASSKSPVRGPAKPSRSPSRPGPKSPARSPLRPHRSPSRSSHRPGVPAPAPERSPQGPRRQSPERGPGNGGPPGLFTNI